MSLEALVLEIRARTEAELRKIEEERSGELARIASERDRRIAATRTEQERQGVLEAGRVRAQVLAAAAVNARKTVYEARERRMQAGLLAGRTVLRDYVDSDEYSEVLRRMALEVTERLGKQVRISGRAEDAARLSKVAGKAFDPTPRPILGGLVAETSDGSRRLDLSFDELLRLREPRVRELFA